jgi:hypothetical protein
MSRVKRTHMVGGALSSVLISELTVGINKIACVLHYIIPLNPDRNVRKPSRKRFIYKDLPSICAIVSLSLAVSVISALLLSPPPWALGSVPIHNRKDIRSVGTQFLPAQGSSGKCRVADFMSEGVPPLTRCVAGCWYLHCWATTQQRPIVNKSTTHTSYILWLRYCLIRLS